MLQMMIKHYPEDGYPYWALSVEYFMEQQYKAARLHLDQTDILFGFPQIAAEARQAAVVSGYRDAVRAPLKGWEGLMSTHQALVPVNIAELYVLLGDKDRTFYWLERAYAQHDVAIARHRPQAGMGQHGGPA
jgi:hypothetical protein